MHRRKVICEVGIFIVHQCFVVTLIEVQIKKYTRMCKTTVSVSDLRKVVDGNKHVFHENSKGYRNAIMIPF